ncbi:hypothetical protein TWF694_010485 [Orbilia ellipsospora]|uniref:Pentatricopeptide repeat protein n=1 Tax=Orbilia ellipsospora TaxID=2528407 RepID=A0AAV9XCQ7_9PEZI
MLARSACLRGCRFAPNVASYANGLVHRRHLSAITTSILAFPHNGTLEAISRSRARIICTSFPRWLDSRRHFWKSSNRKKEEENEEDEEDEEEDEDEPQNPFSEKDAERQMEEYIRSMGGNSRQIRNLFGQFNDAMKGKEELEEHDEVGPYDDVDEEIDPFEQDPDMEPAYKTVYLPTDQLDQMIKSGFLKPLHEIDPLQEEPLEKDVADLPREAKTFLKKFFMRMQYAKAHPSPTSINACWRLFPIIYKNTKLAKLFNDDAWALLWSLEKDAIPSSRKIWLGDLMTHVDANLTEAQWIGYIEALFWHGQRDRAFHIWNLGLQNNPSMIWYTIGTRLHATENQPAAAVKVIEQAIRAKGSGIPKLFLPTIVCYHTMAESSRMQNLKDKEKRYNQEALSVYNKMKMYCPNILPKDYMRVALSFLDAGYFQDAMKVYEDALSVHPQMVDDQATASYWELKFKEAAIRAQNDPSTSDDDLRDLTVNALRLLPDKEKTRIILGNWMRNLIRRNKIEEALKVAKSMQALEMQMDTTTYNLFIMLLTEHGKVGMLENLASRMIRKLLEPMFKHNITYEQVLHEPEFQPAEPKELDLSTSPDDRAVTLPVQTAVQLPEHVEQLLTRFEQKPHTQLPIVNEIRPKPLTALAESVFNDLIRYDYYIPPADPATFGLLLRQSTRTNNALKAISVIELFRTAKMQPHAKLINPLMSMLARHSTIKKLFNTHKALISPDGLNVAPNKDTYRILWVKLLLTLKQGKPLEGVPTPRQIFAEMVSQSGSLEIDQDIYSNILRAFWRASDPVGAYTAMYGMHLVWDKAPIRRDLHITVVGIARLLTKGHVHFARRHGMWYLKHLAHDQFGSWVSLNPIRRRQHMMLKCFSRNQRRKKRLRKEIQEIEAEGGDASRQLAEIRIVSHTMGKQWEHMQKYEEKLKQYWETPPLGLNFPRTEEARAAVSGAIPIELDSGREEFTFNVPEKLIDGISEFTRKRMFNGPWPQQWLDEVLLARAEMGIADEEAIQDRKMNFFNFDE